MTADATNPPSNGRLLEALPFWSSLCLVPVAWAGAIWGGWALLLMPFSTWVLFSIIDVIKGLDTENADPSTPDAALFWYKAITVIWAPVQGLTLFGIIAYVAWSGHLVWWERAGVGIGLGVMCGTIGIVYAHELMHRSTELERWMGDLLMAMALYSHFRSEHLLVHHRFVGTPRDAVTARFGENFHAYFLRVVSDTLPSAWQAEVERLQRRRKPVWHRSNPFWRYAALQLAFVALAALLGGWVGLGIFVLSAIIAIWQLELVDYIEHYGLTRKHLGDGRYEPARTHHSWNAAHKASNWLLINLQRHSDHHTKPGRRYPVLQSVGPDEAPQLPYGYPMTTIMALFPPIWRRVMDPKVGAWRERFYPEIDDWSDYEAGTTPMPL
ncbi:MAG: alkane 1-monooxygenase [Pseudomonadota bacterium]